MTEKRYLPLILAALLLASCAGKEPAQPPEESISETGVQTDALPEQPDSAVEEPASAPVDSKALSQRIGESTKVLYLDRTELSQQDSDRIRAEIARIVQGRELEIIAPEPVKTYYSIYDSPYGNAGFEDLKVTKYLGRYEPYLSVNGCFYSWDEQLDEIIDGLSANTGGTSAPEDSDSAEGRMYTYTLECEEPHTDEEYIDIGQKLASMWLDSLTEEQGRYYLGSYEMTSAELWGKGLVGNGREFCVECWFDTGDIADEEEYNTAFYEEGSYDTFYHYYYGPGIYIRCRWENGVARIVDHTGVFLADLTQDLNGVSEDNTTGYDTFFDFYNDKAACDAAMKKLAVDGDHIVAQAPIMLSDGRISGVSIYPRRYSNCTKRDGKLYGVFDNAYFTDKSNTYSSPVDYKDDDGACSELYSDPFEIIFDDYNCDGDPEFALKQSYTDETRYGARYEVRCMAADQTPRDTRFDFFMAGRHEETIRLQNTGVSGGTSYLTWGLDENGDIQPSEPVDDYRMYSQRYYLPATLRGYDDERQIICYFWNNTGTGVTTGTEYTIEDTEGKVIAQGTIASPVTAQPYREAEIAFDVDVPSLGAGEYRIGISCGQEKVYGGFFVRGEDTSLSIRCTTPDPTAGMYSIEYSITNTGSLPLRISSAELMKGDDVICTADVSDVSLITANNKQSLVFITETPLEEGEYHVCVQCGERMTGGDITLKALSDEDRYVYGGRADADFTGDDIALTLNSTSDLSGKGLSYEESAVEVRTESGWERTVFFPVTGFEQTGSGQYRMIFGDASKTIDADSKELRSTYNFYMNYIDEALEAGEIMEEEMYMYDQIKAMTPLEFYIYLSFGYIPVQPEAGMRCRALMGSEYVYFTL